MRERKLQEEEEAWLGPIAVAQFIELGWIVQPPMMLTRRGLGALRLDYGPQKLPSTEYRHCAGELTDKPDGSLWWPERRHFKPRTLNF